MTSRSISLGSMWQAKSDPTPSKTRESTILTIGRISHGDRDLTNIEVIHHQWWTGMRHGNQYAALSTLMEKWNIRALCIDTTGLGEGLASLLIDRFNSKGHEPIMPFKLARLSQSILAYQVTALVDRGGLSLYTLCDYPSATARECWDQLRKAKYRLFGQEIMDFFVDPSEGYDDFLISLALLCEALVQYTQQPESTIVRPKKYYTDESRY